MTFYGQLWRHYKDLPFAEQSEKISKPLTPAPPDDTKILTTDNMQVEEIPQPKRKKTRHKKTPKS